jgi:hypothetical protein
MVESPNSLGARARARRWELTAQLFPDLADMHVLDLGGTVEAWERAPLKPARVTVLNLTEPGESSVDWITPVKGDACNAREVLKNGYGLNVFDVVFSNAVIEHVGGHANCLKFAESVHAMAPRHWVQTPYRYFPIEPHWLFPGMQFMPVAVRARIAEFWPLAHSPSPSLAAARSSVMWTDLIGVAEMREYFPTSTILHERILGLTKSLIAVKAESKSG